MSPRPLDQILADARDESAFSNGTEWEIWSANWCERCAHDKPARRGKPENGCPLILAVMLGKTPIEFLATSGVDRWACIEFRDEHEPPGWREPAPIPDPPGQETLLPRDGLEGVRMLAGELVEVTA